MSTPDSPCLQRYGKDPRRVASVPEDRWEIFQLLRLRLGQMQKEQRETDSDGLRSSAPHVNHR